MDFLAEYCAPWYAVTEHSFYDKLDLRPDPVVCPGCGYGTHPLGIVLVTRPHLIIDPTDPLLCHDCNPNRVGRRLPGDPPTNELFP